MKKVNQKRLTNYLEIKPQRSRQLNTTHKQTNQISALEKNIDKPKKPIPKQRKQTIQKTHKKHHLNT